MITLTRENNMDMMSRYPDKYFDLAIVDPPYGILNKTKRGGDYKFNMEEYSQWDRKPDDSYFNELFRVSKHQIIWGGNYFGQLWLKNPYNKGFIVWDKNQPETLNNFSMAEMAWSSLDKPAKIFRYCVRKNKNKIHPTQKPVQLYEWLLKMYAKTGDKILDTHLGSGTIAVACIRDGFELTACEISDSYFQKAVAFIQDNTSLNSLNIDTHSMLSNVTGFVCKEAGGKMGNLVKSDQQLKIFSEKKAVYKELGSTLL